MKNKFLTPRDFIDVADKDIYETADYFQEFIDQMDNKSANAFDITTVTPTGSEVKVVDRYTGEIINAKSFVSSNYLGLNTHPKVKEAARKALEKYGAGTSTTPLIGGYLNIHKELESKIAKMHGKEDALLFSSGFAANVGVAQPMLTKKDIAIVDTFIHASMYDGLSSTNVKIFGHNDLEYLELVLKSSQGKYRNMVVVLDGVYSQDGDLPRLREIIELSKKYGAFIILDDAHGVGVFGKNGSGVCSHFGVEAEVDLITGTLSKGLGTMGGYIAGSKQLIKFLRHFARTSIFSASITPATTVSAIKAIELLSEEPQLIEKLWNNTDYIRKQLIESGFDLGRSESPIIPIMVRDDMKAIIIARKLLDRGVYIIPATYPAVKLKDSRLRLNVSASHKKEDLDYFCKSLLEVNKDIKFTIN